MKTLILTLVLFLTSIEALAQNQIDLAHRFQNYEPTVFENDESVTALYSKMETEFKPFNILKFQFGTQCTARAETWSYDLYQTQNIKSEKVFIFYTKAYHAWYKQNLNKPFIWWFHVAPYVLVKNSSGAIEERVLDKSFSEKPLPMKDWTAIFLKSKKDCIEDVPYAAFEGDVTGSGASYDPTAHCYLVRAPMYDMFPVDIYNRENGERSELNFDLSQVRFAAKALKNNAKKRYLKRVGLEE